MRLAPSSSSRSCFLVTILLVACGPRVATPAISELSDDSGVPRAPYEEIVASLRDLQTRHADDMTIFESEDDHQGPDGSGLTVLGRSIFGVRIADADFVDTAGTVRPVVYLNEAIHGNEYLNLADRMIGRFLDARDDGGGVERFLTAGGIILVVPIINPDGYALGQRRNAVPVDPNDPRSYGHDLNRDFADPHYDALVDARPDLDLERDVRVKVGPNFTQVETRFARNILKREMDRGDRRLDLMVTHHCCVDWIASPWLDIKGVSSPWVSDVQKEDYDRVFDLYRDFVNPLYYGAGETILLGTMDRYFDAAYPGALQLTFEGAYPFDSGNADPSRTRDDIARLIDLDRHMGLWDVMLGKIADGTLVREWPRQPPVALSSRSTF